MNNYKGWHMRRWVECFSLVGIIGPVYFIVWLMLLGFQLPGYSHISQEMSVIGAIDSPLSNLMQFGGFSVLGIVWLCFSVLLYATFKKNWAVYAGILLLCIASLSMFLVGFYPCDAQCDNVTAVGKMHSFLAIISNLGFVFGMIFFQFSFHKNRTFSRAFTRVLFFLTVLSNTLSPLLLLAQIEPVLGLVQRAGIFFPLVWTLLVSYKLLGIGKNV